MRKHGLTVDTLQAVDVVTADGKLLRASEDEHPDLFWALRGGGGNFGVATSFECRLHSVGPTVLAGPLLWDATDAGKVLRFCRGFVRDAPDELGRHGLGRQRRRRPRLAVYRHPSAGRVNFMKDDQMAAEHLFRNVPPL